MPGPPIRRHNTLRQYKKLKKLEKRGKARVVQNSKFGGLKRTVTRPKPQRPSRPTGGSNGGGGVRNSNSGGLRIKNQNKNKNKNATPKFRTVTKRSYTPYAESEAGNSSSSENMSQRRLVVTKIKERIKKKKK